MMAGRVRVQFESEFLTVEYEILGDGAFQEARHQLEDGRELGAISAFLTRVITSWDLLDDDQPMPIDEATVSGLPVSVLCAIAGAIRRDVESRQIRPQDDRRN